jgi:hypothetical protein
MAAGTTVERDGKKYKQFYGMSSNTAMVKHSGGVAEFDDDVAEFRSAAKLDDGALCVNNCGRLAGYYGPQTERGVSKTACSSECFDQWYESVTKGERRVIPQPPQCVNGCGKARDPRVCRHGGPRLACSKECYTEWHAREGNAQELEHLLAAPIGYSQLYVHAVWHLSGHARSLWYLVDGDTASLPFCGKPRKGTGTVLECAQLALEHLDLLPSQQLFVATYTPRSNTAAARCGSSIDVVVVAHNNAQAGKWARAVSTSPQRTNPRWLTPGMLLQLGSHFTANITQAPTHVDNAIDFVRKYMISPQVCISPPIYGDRLPECPTVVEEGDRKSVV